MYYITYSKFKYISCSYLSKHGDPEQPKDIKFKYISCSYLSFRWNNPTTVFIYLNTSHVLIYLTSSSLNVFTNLFKYISCSYLSSAVRKEGQAMHRFKYISCSYLSQKHSIIFLQSAYLNTSHVLIYHTYC